MIGEHGRVVVQRADETRVAVVAAAVFAVTAAWQELAGSLPGDRWVLERVHASFGTGGDRAMEVVDAASDSRSIAVATLVIAGGLLMARRVRQAVVLVTVVATAALVNPWLKDAFARPRPTVRPIPVDVSEYAFPSGHAASSAALAAGVVLGAAPGPARVALVAGTITSLVAVAVSQLVLGTHAPSDIVAGWSWVVALAAGIATVSRRVGGPVTLRWPR